MEKMFSIHTDSSNKVRALKFRLINLPSKANFMMIKRKDRGSLTMFQVISTKDNGVMICMRGMGSYTVTQANTKEISRKEKNMDSEKKYLKMAILMKVLIIWTATMALESTIGVMGLRMLGIFRMEGCQGKVFGDRIVEISMKANFTMVRGMGKGDTKKEVDKYLRDSSTKEN